ncbi:MAG TPA: metal-dependent hydrolase [Vicinamibacteria bacterium]
MDPLTQGLLGAAFGQALYGKALGKQALAWGAVVGMAPDLDVVANPVSPMAEWLWHRGPTHALWFGPVVGPLIGWLLWRWRGGRFRDWAGLSVVALLTHPLLDAFTTYGTQLLSPFSSRRFAWDAVAIVDPVYSLVLALAIGLGLRRGARTPLARRAAWTALALSSAYVVLGLLVNHRAEAAARAQLAAEGVRADRVSAYPTLFQLPFRRIVARSGDEVRVGWLSLLAPRPIAWERFVAASGPLVEAARQTEEGRILEWFAMGEATPRVETTAEGAVVELDDLRYGFPGRPQDGLWGVRVRLDASGRPIGRGERFDRRLPAPASELLGRIWRETLGVS